MYADRFHPATSCSCDFPAHSYAFTWEGNPYWSRVYVGAPELYEYFTSRAKAYGVYEHVHLQPHVTEASWDEKTGQYNLIIEDLTTEASFTDKANFLINATGILK